MPGMVGGFGKKHLNFQFLNINNLLNKLTINNSEFKKLLFRKIKG